MSKLNAKSLLCISGFALLVVGVAIDSGSFDIANLIRYSRALTHTTTLNNTNHPTLSGGEGTMIDDKNVTWEYHNASDYAAGHVKLNHEGHLGVASTTPYGYTRITSVKANFSSGVGDELWLLSSVDGTTWNECEILTSGQASTKANDYRYIRFYAWNESGTPISVNSIIVDYDCTDNGDAISATEDVDGAHIENVIATSNTTAYEETTNVSPLGDSTRAIRFEKQNSGTYAIIGFGREYQLANIKDKRVEFDLYATVEYGKTIQLVYNSTTVGSTIESSKHTSYKVFVLGDHWYHIEVHINALSSMFCSQSQGDIPATNKKINGIKINVGNGVVDNLRIGSIPSSNVTEVGIFNQNFIPNGNKCKTNDWSKNYWLKISWTGVFHSCQMIIADTSIAEPVTGLEYPFYITPKAVGTTTVTMKLCVGYTRNYVFAVFEFEIYE